MSGPVRIGTRGSPLALWQANEVARLLGAAGYAPEIVVVRTTGDARTDVALASIGGKGLFVKELEEALERGTIDMAVHSLKDVPSILPEPFELAGFLPRADPRDAWLGTPLSELPPNARVGTSSPRRRAQLLARNPDFDIQPLRGNVGTRIEKLHRGEFDGIVLAAAGLGRLGRSAAVTSFFSVDEMVPAAGQGIVAIETLRGTPFPVSDPTSALAVRCERGVLQKFGTRLDCYSTIAVHATIEEDSITIRAFLSDPDAKTVLRTRQTGGDPEALVDAVASDLINRGAFALLEANR
jgi:hydroxymethylbilane synthase